MTKRITPVRAQELFGFLCERVETCNVCDGTGHRLDDPESACRACGGTGYTLDANAAIAEFPELTDD